MAPLAPLTGPVYVDQPLVGDIRYGLFSAAAGPLPLPAHGEVGGVQYLEEHCGQGHLWAAASCSAPTVNSGVKFIDSCDGAAIGLPFTVLASLQMGAIPWSEEEVTRRVNVRLRDNAQQVVEQALWGGTADVGSVLATANIGFTNTDATPTPGTPVPLEQGVAILEDFLSNYGYTGVFHCRPYISPFATERLLSVPDKGSQSGSKVYRTPMGNTWSFGRGYAGTHPLTGAAVPGPPTAPAVANAYIQATGPVTIWAGEAYTNPIFQAMSRTTNPSNQLYAIAEQPYALTIDCTAAFVLVSLVGM